MMFRRAGIVVFATSLSLYGQVNSVADKRPTSGVTPAFQSGGPRTTELSLSWIF